VLTTALSKNQKFLLVQQFWGHLEVQTTVAGLQAGENHNAASIVLGEAENFRLSAEKLAQVIEFYRDPDARNAMAYLIAGQNIAAKEGKKFNPQRMVVSVPFLELPSAPDFSRFYSSADLSQPQLGTGNPAQNTSGSPTISPENDKNDRDLAQS
jgi:hypothetical protein